MSRTQKAKTAPLPHRVMNKTSIYLAKQCKVDRKDFLGYESIVTTEDAETIIIRSHADVTPQDGKVFEYILAQWFATLKELEELKEIEVDVVEIVNALGWQNRTENRNKVIQHLRNLVGVSIIYNWDGGELLFHLIEKVEIIDGNKTIALSVSQTYLEAFKTTGKRYINVSNILPLKGKYEIELYKLLQMLGGGIGNQGQPKLAKKIALSDIVSHLHLDVTNSNNIDIISRAFRNLHKNNLAPKYKYNGRLERWETT
jgi:hypothetical protein